MVVVHQHTILFQAADPTSTMQESGEKLSFIPSRIACIQQSIKMMAEFLREHCRDLITGGHLQPFSIQNNGSCTDGVGTKGPRDGLG
jgi:hypothetical protein